MDYPPRNDGPEDDEPRDGGPHEAAHYIKASLDDLGRMARRHGHDMLGYLLDMAHMEADEILRRGSRRSGH